MFRRLPSSLPDDYHAPRNLEQLGFFINDKDQLRSIANPDQKYQYRINRNDRVNEACKEAINACLRNIVQSRLTELSLETLRLPLGAKENEQHIPVYISPDFKHKQRVLILFGERNQDLGIFSYRSIREDGVRVGSAQALVNAIVNDSKDTAGMKSPSIVITNPGQLIWYRNGSRAIGYSEYLGVGRRSAVDNPFHIDPHANRVPGNADFEEHVQYIFEKVLLKMAPADAKFDIIGLEYTGDAVVQYLAGHWDVWRDRVNGLCLGNPQFRPMDLNILAGFETTFFTFLAERTRAYFVSDKPIETPLPGCEERGFNCYASGEDLYDDGILIKGWKSMLDWFNMISALEDYKEPTFTMIEVSDTEELDG